MRLRVGAVSYLNTKPLIAHLAELSPSIDLRLEVPSKLADDLAAGRLDIALIPSIEYFRHPGYSIVRGVSIASFGPVLSVKLCSRVPFERISSVALDEGSRTSVALTRILLDELFDVRPAASPLPLESDYRKESADAVLLIGDRAMKVRDGTFPYMLDLGYEWSRWTGLPFVFAFWAARAGLAVSDEVASVFVRAKEMGRREIPEICRRESLRLGLDEVQCRYYLESVIRHDLGPEELAGLDRFRQTAIERGLAPEGASCVFNGDLAESH